MRIGIIDLGSNTFNLLVWDYHLKETIFNTKIPVKIGKGGYENGCIREDAISRALDALQVHKSSALEYGSESIVAIATSAIRSSSNKAEFCDKVLNETGIHINVVDGDEEALLVKMGVEQAIEESNECGLIIDIGGGSTEFIIFKNEDILWQKSYPLGVSRMYERFSPSDPLTQNEISQINTDLKIDLIELYQAIDNFAPTRFIGSSGSFETFYTCLAYQNHHPQLLNHQTNAFIKRDEFLKFCNQLIKSNFKERLSIQGMPEMRADTIQLSAILCKLILDKRDFKYIELSLYALKEGVISALTKNDNKWQRSLL